MGARQDAEAWADAVRAVSKERGLTLEPVGGLNPVGGPVALCPGGTNRMTGELTPGFWGAACDADEREAGGFGRKAVVPGAALVKAHTPDLATVVPIFNVESLERSAGDTVDRMSRRRVRFESIEFNKRYIATVPKDHDPVALRELFSPAFIDWITQASGRGRLRHHRQPALLSLAPARADAVRARGRPRRGSRHLQGPAAGDGRERAHHLQPGPLERGPRALPGGT